MSSMFFASIGVALVLAVSAQPADLSNRLGSPALSGLSQDQMVAGLKETLAKGIQHAVTNLGQTNGFLKDANVRIPMPESLRKVEKGLRTAGQSRLADDFVTTMNRAAEQAVPQAASVLGDAVRQMTVADANALIVAKTNTAATDYFRHTSQTNLYARFLPIVKRATEQTGVTAAYKQMSEKINLGGLEGLGGLLGAPLNKEALDIDAYVTRKALEGLFLKIAEQEKLIRENPAARTTELLQRVFGSLRH